MSAAAASVSLSNPGDVITADGYFVPPKLHQKQLKLLSKKRAHSSSSSKINDDLDDSKFNYRDLPYPIHPIPNSVISQIPKAQLSNLPSAVNNPIIRNKYITSSDPRNYITTFEYKINDQYVMWDYNTGYVHLTGIWKAIGNSKADIITLLDNAPELVPHLRRIRGGFLKIQGSWVTFDHCYKLATKFCWEIRYCLVPLFGEKFLQDVLKPTDPGYGELKLNSNGDHSTSKRKVSKCAGPHNHLESKRKKKRSKSEIGTRSFQQKKKFFHQHQRSNSSNTDIKPHFNYNRGIHKAGGDDIALVDDQYCQNDDYFDDNNNDDIFTDDSNNFESPIKYNDSDKVLSSQFYSIHDDSGSPGKENTRINHGATNNTHFYSKDYSFETDVADIDKFEFKRNSNIIYQPVYPTTSRRASHSHYIHNLSAVNNGKHGRYSGLNTPGNASFSCVMGDYGGSPFDSLVFAATELSKIRQNSAPSILLSGSNPMASISTTADATTTAKNPNVFRKYNNSAGGIFARNGNVSKNGTFDKEGLFPPRKQEKSKFSGIAEEEFKSANEDQFGRGNAKLVHKSSINRDRSSIFPIVDFQNYIFS